MSEETSNSKAPQNAPEVQFAPPISETVRLTDIEKIRSLPWQILGGMGFGVFCLLTIFGSVFILFLNELGIDKARIGVILSLIPFCGILALFTAPAVARIGFKRTTIVCYGLRKIVAALLILTPIMLNRFGIDVAFAWVAGVVLVFAILRSLAETAHTVWTQELIPNKIRGKFTALNSILTTAASITAVLAASYIVDKFTGIGRFQFLIGAGSIIGLGGVICYTFLPGGAPVRSEKTESTHLADMIAALHDRNFRILLGATGLVLFAWASWARLLSANRDG